MAVQLQFRRGTASEWTIANPILAEGELGLELDSNKFKLGNGITRWNSLLYTSTFNVTKDISSDITYPTFVSGVGVISAGISTGGLVYKQTSSSLGIGTTNPTSKLWVDGGGYFTGVVTAKEFSGTATSTTNIPNLSGDITSNNTSTTLATVNSNVGTFGSDSSIPSITVNAKGLVTGVTTNSITVGDGQLSLGVSGIGLSGSATFTANQQTNVIFNVTSNATSANTQNTIVSRDSSGNFDAGTITANVTGNLIGIADTAKELENLRDFSVSGDVATASSVSFNGTGNVNLSVALSTNFSANTVGIITASQFSTGSTGIGINTDTISGPSIIYIDPTPVGVGETSGIVRIKGDLYVDGTQFVINSSTIELADLRIGIATTVGTNLLLDGGGIGIGSANILKTFTYNQASDSLKSSENLDINTGKTYKINGTNVLSSTTLGLSVTNSSLTSVGTLTNLNVGNVYSTGIITATDFNSASDIKLKENIQNIDNPIDKIIKINGVRFDWKIDNKPSMGVIAQNIEKVLPELVSGEDSKTVNYNGIIGLLIECVKTQQGQIEDLNRRLDELSK